MPTPQPTALTRPAQSIGTPPTEVWVPALTDRGLIAGVAPSTEASAYSLLPAGGGRVGAGVGLNVTTGSRRYARQFWDGKSRAAWLVVAYRNNAAAHGPAVFRAVFRKDGTILPLQDHENDQIICAVWSGAGGVTGVYGNTASVAGKISVFAGRVYSDSAAACYLNGGPPVPIAFTGPISSGGKVICIGGDEVGAETASDWTTLLCAAWDGVCPSEAEMYAYQADPWSLLAAPSNARLLLSARALADLLMGQIWL